MGKGIFITLEGPDGSGKSTQLKYIREHFEGKSDNIVFTREPGGTFIGEKIREIILCNSHTDMCNRTEALLFAAARAQHVEEVIMPALSEGKIVICDRYVDSSIIYQGYARGLGEDVRIINEFATKRLLPDLTILLMVEPQESIDRLNRKEMPDRLDEEKMEFHKRAYEAYMEMAKNEDRFRIIDATKRIDETKKAVLSYINEALEALL